MVRWCELIMIIIMVMVLHLVHVHDDILQIIVVDADDKETANLKEIEDVDTKKVRGWGRDGAGMVQGWCRDGTGLVQGWCQ